MKTIKGDLILKKDFEIDDDLTVEGNIICKNGLCDINARDINACDINARNITACDINARDITAWNINAWDITACDINAWDIICEKRIKKNPDAKTTAKIFITERSKLKTKGGD